jgi:hypothetical protein
MPKDVPIDVRSVPAAGSLETATALAEAIVESLQEERLGRAAVLSSCLASYLRDLAVLRFGAAAGRS